MGYMTATFIGYHLVKSILWRMGHFANFFYRTRSLTIPIYAYGFYWNMKRTMLDMKDAQVLEYNRRRVKFDRDSHIVEKVLKNRMNLMKEMD